MVNKQAYYVELNGLVTYDVAERIDLHTEAINAIADDDPDYIIWCNAAIEAKREYRFRTEVDGHYLRQVEAEYRGGTPDYDSCMAMKDQIRLDLPYKVA